MLEQRRAQQKGYITLKEAAELSNYTPDYVGQLLRAGKLKGEQVYSNVAWVTTPEEVQRYLANKTGGASTFDASRYEKYLRYIIYSVICLLTVLILSFQYILYVSVDQQLTNRHLTNQQQQADSMSKNLFVYE